MPVATSTVTEDSALRWRESAEGDNPAGPLYPGGAFAEADMVGLEAVHTAGAFCTILYACSAHTGCCN